MTVDKIAHEQLKANVNPESIQPWGSYVLLKYPEQPKEAQTASGIFLPAENEKKPDYCEVVKVAPQLVEELKPEQLPCIGNKVMFYKGSQYDLCLTGDSKRPSHCLVAWYDIVCIVE